MGAPEKVLAPMREIAEEEKGQQQAAHAPHLEALGTQEERTKERAAEAEASLVTLKADLAAKQVAAGAAKPSWRGAHPRSAEDSFATSATTAGIQAALQAAATVLDRFKGQPCDV